MPRKPSYKPDSNGRISLGRYAKGVDAFEVRLVGSNIHLIPLVYASKIKRYVTKETR